MTSANGAGIVFGCRFRDSFCSRLRLSELVGTEMPRLIDRPKTFHGEIESVSERRFAAKVR